MAVPNGRCGQWSTLTRLSGSGSCSSWSTTTNVAGRARPSARRMTWTMHVGRDPGGRAEVAGKLTGGAEPP